MRSIINPAWDCNDRNEFRSRPDQNKFLGMLGAQRLHYSLHLLQTAACGDDLSYLNDLCKPTIISKPSLAPPRSASHDHPALPHSNSKPEHDSTYCVSQTEHTRMALRVFPEHRNQLATMKNSEQHSLREHSRARHAPQTTYQ